MAWKLAALIHVDGWELVDCEAREVDTVWPFYLRKGEHKQTFNAFVRGLWRVNEIVPDGRHQLPEPARPPVSEHECLTSMTKYQLIALVKKAWEERDAAPMGNMEPKERQSFASLSGCRCRE